MNNTNFIKAHGSIIRTKDISMITSINSVHKEDGEGGYEFSHNELKIVLNSGYTLTLEHHDKKKLNRFVKELLKELS